MNKVPETIYLIPGEDIDGVMGYLWCDDPAPSNDHDPSEAVEYVRVESIRQITPAMIEAGAQRLVRWDENSVWPDSWSALDVAAARQDAERAILSALSVMGGGDEHWAGTPEQEIETLREMVEQRDVEIERLRQQAKATENGEVK